MYCNSTAALSVPVSALLSTLIVLVAVVLIVSTARHQITNADVIGRSLLEDEDEPDRDGVGGTHDYTDHNDNDR